MGRGVFRDLNPKPLVSFSSKSVPPCAAHYLPAALQDTDQVRSPNPQALKPSNPQALKPSNPQALKPSNPQTLKPLTPKTLEPIEGDLRPEGSSRSLES